MISKEEVQKIAKLARLELTGEEIEKMQKDLSSILDYFEILKKAKKGKTVSKVAEGKNEVREDVSKERDDELVGKLLEQIPDRKEDYIKVKKVLK